MNKIAILFPGQASQYVGMGKELWKKYKIADEIFQQAHDLLGVDIKKLCKDANQLKKTQYAQLCIFVCSVAAYKVLKHETQIKGGYFAGHSMGEYAALVCSGCLNFEEGIKLINKRGEIMGKTEKQSNFAMANMGNVDNTLLYKACKEISTDLDYMNMACDNSIHQKIVAGSYRAVESLISYMKELGINGKIVNTLGAFHTPYMYDAQEEFKEYLREANFQTLETIVVSNVTGRAYPDESHIYPLLSKQMVSMVKWRQAMDYLKSKHVDLYIEVGPGSVLTNLLKRANDKVKAFSMDDINDYKSLLDI